MKKKIIVSLIAVIIISGIGFATYSYTKQKTKFITEQNANLKAQVTEQNQELANSNKAVQINLHIKDGAFAVAAKELASLTNPQDVQALTAKLNLYKQTAQNFNNTIANALNNLKQNHNIDTFSKAINNLNTSNLISSDVQKLNELKETLPNLTKLKEVQNLILAKDFTQAKDTFETINQNLLIKAGILAQDKLTKIQNFINNSLSTKKEIINSVNQKVSELKNKQLDILNQL
ncbi:hypothetical protein [uncultured Clostridium sp.]|jgi:hypothetical protein|uniref:hypothetical protein n=1 Tax=uncultured Clostridium sp. TaxID=59620 RepID=UPI00260329A2|nr:hypothetical protein [uncultured Clostridium sp.]